MLALRLGLRPADRGDHHVRRRRSCGPQALPRAQLRLEGGLHQPGVRSAGGRPAVAAGLADRLPLEEIPNVGDFVTYDIVDNSIMRRPHWRGRDPRLHNVCQHRGRRLTEGCGHGEAVRLPLPRLALRPGRPQNVTSVDAAGLGPAACEARTSALKPVQVGHLGRLGVRQHGSRCAAPGEFLAPVIERVGRLRARQDAVTSGISTILYPCNWKVAIEASTRPITSREPPAVARLVKD